MGQLPGRCSWHGRRYGQRRGLPSGCSTPHPVEQSVGLGGHATEPNPKVAGSNPAPATKKALVSHYGGPGLRRSKSSLKAEYVPIMYQLVRASHLVAGGPSSA